MFKRRKPSGVLFVSEDGQIDGSNFYLELSENPSEIAKKQYVTFKVEVLKSQK